MATATKSIDAALAKATESGELAGTVGVVTRNGETIYEGAHGRRAVGDGAPMTTDTVVWIASMTKAITGAAAMQLVEQGKLSLDAPAAEIVPDIARVPVLEGFDNDGKPQTRPPKRAITLRHLLTHTSGFSYDMWNASTGRYAEAAGIPPLTNCENAGLFTALAFDPGDAWEYGIGIDWAGKMVEAASGTDLQSYMRTNIFEPLGMHDTSFTISAAQRAKLSAMHARLEDGSLTAMPFEITQTPEFFMGGGGLYGTALDYSRFAQAILGGGALNGTRILAAGTVAEMSRNNMGDVNVAPMRSAIAMLTKDSDFYPGMACKWGLSFLINTEVTPQGRSAGSLAWAGLANTYYWIDPTKQVTGVFASQVLPFFDDHAIGAFRAFESAVYASL